MEKRIFTAVLISIGFLWLWAYAAPKVFPEYFKPPTKTAKPAPSTTTVAQRESAPTPVPAPGSVAAPEHAPAPVNVAPTNATKRQLSRIETKDFIALFSNRGAELVSFQLKHYQSKSGGPVELVKAREPIRTDFPFAIESPNAAVAERLNSALWEITQNNQTITYRYAGEGIAATKTFSFAGDYPFTFAVSVAPAIPYRVAIGPASAPSSPTRRNRCTS